MLKLVVKFDEEQATHSLKLFIKNKEKNKEKLSL